ncbi:MAG: tRNA (guanosine(37)-N1)-methyltransferase TrmD, partial [Pseudomonadota bacterium]
MNFKMITLFPEMVLTLSKYGVVGRAFENKLASLEVFNPRDFTNDPNRRVDDRPYGGGPGMVMEYEPLEKSIQRARVGTKNAHVICLSAQGKPCRQVDIARLGKHENLILLAGRYEGIDERLIESEVDEEISIGDFVVSGGELPAMLLMDALVRQIPGSLGHEASSEEDSFVDGLLDCPHYTRPESINGLSVPKVLLGGDHQAIKRWREKQSLGRTFQRRP